MKYADISRCVASLPVTTDKPLTLTQSTVTADHFMQCPVHEFKHLPPRAMIEAAIEAGRCAGR